MSIQCIDALSLLRSLPDKSVDLIFTDSPYESTDLDFDKDFDFNWEEFFIESWRVLRDKDRPILLFAGNMFQAKMKYVYRKWFRYEWIIEKGKGTGGQNAYVRPMACHEYILVYGQLPTVSGAHKETLRYYPIKVEGGEPYIRKNKNSHKMAHINGDWGHKAGTVREYDGSKFPRSVQLFKWGNNGSLHPTQKPLSVCEYFIETYSQIGDVVLDPFCGSGSIGLAAKRLQRQYILGDINPDYVAIATQRIEIDPVQIKGI